MKPLPRQTRTILCTVGTSIAGGCPELGRFQKQGSVWADDTVRLQSEITERLRRFDLTTANGRVTASAELNSLHRYGLLEGDEVILLATDTADGRACAHTLSRVIEETWLGSRTKIERIEGLQVRDAERLRRTGLTRLLQTVLTYVEDPQRQYGGGLVLNPTGGFKGIVPFLTTVGMIFHVPTFYVFEFSDALIRLPPLPISFDLELFLRARPAVASLQKEGVMPEERFYKLIPGFEEGERPYFQSLLEVDGSDATLSPLALTLAEMQESERKAVWLSPQAQEKMESLQGTNRKRLEDVLTRFANPLWRVGQSHSFPSCELPVFGGKKLPFRMAAVFRGGRAYLCRLYRVEEHDTYEAEFAKLRLRDYETLDNFIEWKPSVAEGELDAAAQSELEQLRAEIAGIPEKIAEETRCMRTEIKGLQQLRQEQKKVERDLKKQLAETQQQLKMAQRVARKSDQKAEADKPATEPQTEPAERMATAVPPPALKGTVQAATFIGEGRKGKVLDFALNEAGGWEGSIPKSDATRLGELQPGAIAKLRVAGIAGHRLQLALPRANQMEPVVRK